ncbi:MAG TPA: hypothetical protein VFT95_19200 [Micromonosporaceae bacterium]|nr:hypothetical protein [Micromonosporaceae bacterium]
MPVGDIVSGDPPVPITVWHVPAPPPGEVVSSPLAVRLVHNFTHPGELIVDATDGTQLARAIIAAGRRRLAPTDAPAYPIGQAALLVAAWPVGDPATADAVGRWIPPLRDGGSLAVVLPHTGPTAQADLVAAGHDAGLAYLQHIVAVTSTSARGARRGGRGGHTRLRVHSDILVLTRTRPDDRASDA